MELGEDFFTEYFELLAGTKKLRMQIINGLSIEEIRQSWEPELKYFKEIRAKYLFYPE